MRQDMIDLYRIYRDRVFQLLGYALVASLVAVVLNFAGLKVANLVAGIILPVIVAYIVTAPEVVLAVLSLGAVAHPTSPIDSAGNTARAAARFVGWLLLVQSFFFLVAGTLQFSRNPGAILAIYVALIVLFLVGLVWDMTFKLAKPLVYWYAFSVVVIGIGALISGPTYTKAIGFDPYWVFKVNPLDEQLDRLQKESDTEERKAFSAKLDVIEQKIKAGQPLDEADKAAWDAAKKHSTLPGKLKSGLEQGRSLMSGSADSSDSPQKAGSKVQEKIVHFEAGEVVNTQMVQDVGNVVQFINPTATCETLGTGKNHPIHPGQTATHITASKGYVVIIGGKQAGSVTVKITG